jgi:hypothetical protein
MRLPLCAICTNPCIPLADYDMPTCIGCDETMRLILARAGMLEQPRPRPRLVRPTRRVLKPCGTHAAFNRHKQRGEPIDPTCDAAERRYHAERYVAAQHSSAGECTVRIRPRRPA